MRSFSSTSPACWAARSIVVAAFLGCAATIVSGQNRLTIPSPFDLEDRLDVLALDGTLCVVDLGFGLERVAAHYYGFEEATTYADGFIEINRPVGRIMQSEVRTTFEFNVTVRPSRDYADCFVALQLFTKDGRELILPHEVNDLEAGKVQTVSFSPKLAYEDLDRGIYYYHFFSGGEEIYFAPTQFKLGKKRQRPLALRAAGNAEPELAQVPQESLPQPFVSRVSGEEALIAIGVNDSGYSVDHLVLSSTNSLAARMATDLVKRARFTPGAEEGFFVRKDLLLRVRFGARGDYQFSVE